MTERRPIRDRDPLMERLARGVVLLAIAVGFAVLWMLLMEASRHLWRWLGWG